MMQIQGENSGGPKVQCNCCGRYMFACGDVLQEDILQVEKDWGYFSEKDGMKHKWTLCEACYDELVKSFEIPLEETDRTELL